jgi:hypothetical protein
MIIHKDSIDESLLNQLKSYFQTVVYSVSKTSLLSSPQICLKYVIEIESKNLKSSKMTSHTETVYLNKNEFKIDKIEKQNILITNKSYIEQQTTTTDQFRGLTFNVHTNINDLQIKNELVLPYELIGYN